MTRKQKAYVFLALDLLLIPAALLFTFTVQALPVPPAEALLATLPVLPYLVAIAAGLSVWLGLPSIQLKAYERHAIGLTAIYALALVAVSAMPTFKPLANERRYQTVLDYCRLAARRLDESQRPWEPEPDKEG